MGLYYIRKYVTDKRMIHVSDGASTIRVRLCVFHFHSLEILKAGHNAKIIDCICKRILLCENKPMLME